MPSRHSSVVGGSSAARVLNCPGSGALLAQLPKVTNRDSSYSIEGTALHTAMEMLITEKVTLATLPATINANGHEVEISEALIADALRPAMVYWDLFLNKVDHWQLETEVEFPGIIGAFGTCDVIGRDDRDNITYVTDWKFGAGEPVKAAYLDPDDPFLEIVNEQLMFYACGARNSQPQYFPSGCRVVLTIVQPRARGQEPITETEVSLEEMDDFEESLCDAIKRTETKKGRWCRFQACQTICPHFVGPLLDIEVLTKSQVPVLADKSNKTYQLTLLDILNAAPTVEALIAEARAQAHLIMSDGGEVPGWKLVSKRGTRQWTVSEDQLPKLLKLPKKDLYDTKLKSPAGVEKILPKKTKLPDGITSVVSSGTTIAPANDPRPAVAADANEISKILLEVLGDEA
jgi:hypothetical protein